MALDHLTSHRVHAALKADLDEGRIARGRLNVADLANRYMTSVTPVREALMRLAGEGLIAIPVCGGFYTEVVTPATARELLDVQLVLMSAVVARLRRGRVMEQRARLSDEVGRQDIYKRLAQAAGSDQLAALVRSNGEKLRLAELGRDAPDSAVRIGTAVLLDAIHRQDWRRASQEMRRYHRRVSRDLARAGKRKVLK
jgi:DNA-binding GntR family transcriptional regulator